MSGILKENRVFPFSVLTAERKTQMNTRRFVRNGMWACVVLALIVLIAWESLHWGNPSVQAATPAKTRFSVQMLHGTFADQNLPEDGSTVTLVSIPFTTTATADIQVGGTSVVILS
jgi:hypothetical protein